MKQLIGQFFLTNLKACLFTLLCLTFVNSASVEPSTDVHFCLPLDFEDMRVRDSIYAARKHAYNLNVGEPRTVRMIYFLPNDRSFRAEVVDSMKTSIRRIQTFYADQMEARGYGRKTFRFETDAEGEPLVHRTDGQHSDSHYLGNTSANVLDEIEQVFDPVINIYFIVIDNSINRIGSSGRRVGGIGGSRGKNGGYGLVHDEFNFRTAAHELGHAFGLRHDFRDNTYIMSYGSSQPRSLSACHAKYLAMHPYFNPDIPIEEVQSPTVERISPVTYPAGTNSVSIQLKVSDTEGLHQVVLFDVTREPHFAAGSLEVEACRGLVGEKETIVEFNYGIIPSVGSTSLSGPVEHPIIVRVVDTDGNVSSTSFMLREISPQYIAAFEGHTDWVLSMSFSPDGITFASGGSGGTIKLWDVVTKEDIFTFEDARSIGSVVFSPDGTILAAGTYRVIKLWDVSTRANIAALEGHKDWVLSMSFSPGGTMLASGSWDRTVKLWDVSTRANIATFEGHTGGVYSVSFSPDDTTFASGSADGTVLLWDVLIGEQIAILEGHKDEVKAVGFSSDGTMLASGSSDGTIKLWDVSTRANIATLEEHRSRVESVVFSPDGTILASGSGDRTIKLWDVETGRSIATFEGHSEGVYSLEFSLDGTILASGSADGTVLLWDVSQYVTPVVYIPDVNLRAVIRSALGKVGYGPITREDMASLTALDARNRNIRELDGLAFATNLTELNLVGNPLSSISINTHIPALQERGVEVLFKRPPTSDFDGDGIVSFGDFLLFAAQFGFSEDDEGYEARFDLDGDDVIGFGDFLIFVNAFGSRESSGG